MQCVFRVDASLQIGMGHVTRCLTLADALVSNGARCSFVCRESPGDFIDYVRKRGFDVFVLPVGSGSSTVDSLTDGIKLVHANWLDVGWKEDATDTLGMLSGYTVDWIVVDHYALDARWESMLKPACRQLMVIDDLADRTHDCDVLLDQNLGRRLNDYSQFVREQCKFLIGPDYALLKPEFSLLRESSLIRRMEPEVNQILIAMGGVDQADVTSKVLERLTRCQLSDSCKVVIVMGPNAPWLSKVQSHAAETSWTTDVRVNVTEMAELMAESDIAIGAAGMTAWERCCLGLPSLIIVAAENQWPGAIGLQEAKAIILLGDINDIASRFVSTFAAFVSKHSLEEISRCASSITEGRGAEKVAMVLGAER